MQLAPEYFYDIDSRAFRTHPMEVLRASSISANGFKEDLGDKPGIQREVRYHNPATGMDLRLKLQLWQHAGGAWNIQVPGGPAVANSATAGSPEGRIVHSDGTMKQAVGGREVIAGALFHAYFERRPNRDSGYVYTDDFQNGDRYWIVTEASHWQLLSAAAVAANALVVADGAAGFGQVDDDAASVQTALATSKAAAAGADTLFDCTLHIGPGNFVPN